MDLTKFDWRPELWIAYYDSDGSRMAGWDATSGKITDSMYLKISLAI